MAVLDLVSGRRSHIPTPPADSVSVIVGGAAWSPDGSMLAVAEERNPLEVINIWKLAPVRLVQAITIEPSEIPPNTQTSFLE